MILTTSIPWVGVGPQLVWAPAIERPGRPAIIYSHGAGGECYQAIEHEVARWAVEDGYTVVAHRLGTTTTDWAIPASVAVLDDLVDELFARGHGSVQIFGVSMGAALAARYELVHPGKAAGLSLSVPAIDMEFLAINANSPLTSPFLLSAWGGQAAWDAVKADVNPARFAPRYAGIQLWFSEDDAVFGSSPGFTPSVLAFARAASIKPISLGYREHTLFGHNRELALEFFEKNAT